MSDLEEFRKAVLSTDEFYAGDSVQGYQLVSAEIIEQSRWTTFTLYAYKADASGEVFGIVHESGSTEYQEGDYEDEFAELEIDPTVRYRRKRQ